MSDFVKLAVILQYNSPKQDQKANRLAKNKTI